MIARTPTLHAALRDVDHGDISFCDGMRGGHPAGFVWATGGEIPQAEQMELSALSVACLIVTIPTTRAVTAPVVLTPLGQIALPQWDAADSPARTVGVHRAGDTEGGTQ